MLSWTMNNCLHLKRNAVPAVLAGSSLSDSIISLESFQRQRRVRSPQNHRAQHCAPPDHQKLPSADQRGDIKPTMIMGQYKPTKGILSIRGILCDSWKFSPLSPLGVYQRACTWTCGNSIAAHGMGGTDRNKPHSCPVMYSDSFQ